MTTQGSEGYPGEPWITPRESKGLPRGSKGYNNSNHEDQGLPNELKGRLKDPMATPRSQRLPSAQCSDDYLLAVPIARCQRLPQEFESYSTGVITTLTKRGVFQGSYGYLKGKNNIFNFKNIKKYNACPLSLKIIEVVVYFPITGSSIHSKNKTKMCGGKIYTLN